MKKFISLGVLLAATALFATGCNCRKTTFSSKQIAEMKAQIDSLIAGQQLTEDYLVKFDTLDFVVFSRQEWVRLHESHDQNIKVFWPDGHFTEGIERHIEDLSSMFVYAPDTRITQHPIRFGSGKFTAVTGFTEGTFTQPMPTGDGKFIAPTGKKFKIPMCTIGIWEDGVMVEEHLFWDNETMKTQMGI